MANTVKEAIRIANEMINTGVVYLYGFKYQVATEAKIKQLAKMYPSYYGTKNMQLASGKIGKIAIDCSGFVCRAFGIVDVNSTSLSNMMTEKIPVSDSTKLKNGMIIWRNGHIGIIEVDDAGNAWVLEAKGTAYDLTKTRYSERGKDFTYYGELRGVDYSMNSVKYERVKVADAIDISHHNTIDLKQARTEFEEVIIRIGYRAYATGVITLDNKFINHARDAIENGFKYGVYFFDQSLNEKEAEEQADWVCGLIKPLNVTLPVYIDSEYSNVKHNGRADSISKEQRTKNVIAFCERIKKHGYKAGVYASDSWYKSMLDYPRLTQYDIWVARYSENTPTISQYNMWQYGSKVIPGSMAAIDVNYRYEIKAVESHAEKAWCSVLATQLNVRNKPSTSGTILRALNRGDVCNVLSLEKGWAKISDKEEYVKYTYLSTDKGSVYNCNKLNLRHTPGNGYVITVLSQGNMVNILYKDPASGWYYIEFNGYVGYVSDKYIKV